VVGEAVGLRVKRKAVAIPLGRETVDLIGVKDEDARVDCLSLSTLHTANLDRERGADAASDGRVGKL
jgi:hypothetical protein